MMYFPNLFMFSCLVLAKATDIGLRGSSDVGQFACSMSGASGQDACDVRRNRFYLAMVFLSHFPLVLYRRLLLMMERNVFGVH